MLAHTASLLLCVTLSSVSCWAQAVTVSLKVHITYVSTEHKHTTNPTDGGGSGGVVVWLTPLDRSMTLPARNAPAQGYRLVQKDKQFKPHLLVVPTGTSIDFPNQDPFFHNVFSLFNGKRFDLGLYEAGSHRSVRFDREGVSYIFCNIHPAMSAVVVSLRTPYYAISSNDGSLTLSSVPPGEYALNLWAEGVAASDLAAASRQVRITNDSLSLGTINLTRLANSMEHKNKFGEDYKPTSDNPY